MNILGFIKNLLPRIEKDTMLEDIRITKKEIENNLIPIFNDSSNHFRVSKLKSQEVLELSNIFYRNYSLAKSSNSVNIVYEINLRLKNVVENINFIEIQMEKLLEHDIIKEGLTFKKGILIKAANDVYFISKYAIDLLNYIYVKETQANNSEYNITISPSKEKKVIADIGKFARLLSIYGEDPKTFSKTFIEVPDVKINENNYDAVLATYEKELSRNPDLIMNFTYNPIYHIRLIIAEWQSNRYKAYRDKKRLLELRLLYLQSTLENNPDPKIEKEIEYLQNRIESIEYKMAKLES